MIRGPWPLKKRRHIVIARHTVIVRRIIITRHIVIGRKRPVFCRLYTIGPQQLGMQRCGGRGNFKYSLINRPSPLLLCWWPGVLPWVLSFWLSMSPTFSVPVACDPCPVVLCALSSAFCFLFCNHHEQRHLSSSDSLLCVVSQSVPCCSLVYCGSSVNFRANVRHFGHRSNFWQLSPSSKSSQTTTGETIIFHAIQPPSV